MWLQKSNFLPSTKLSMKQSLFLTPYTTAETQLSVLCASQQVGGSDHLSPGESLD